jgi:hypothetical protein
MRMTASEIFDSPGCPPAAWADIVASLIESKDKGA